MGSPGVEVDAQVRRERPGTRQAAPPPGRPPRDPLGEERLVGLDPLAPHSGSTVHATAPASGVSAQRVGGGNVLLVTGIIRRVETRPGGAVSGLGSGDRRTRPRARNRRRPCRMNRCPRRRSYQHEPGSLPRGPAARRPDPARSFGALARHRPPPSVATLPPARLPLRDPATPAALGGAGGDRLPALRLGRRGQLLLADHHRGGRHHRSHHPGDHPHPASREPHRQSDRRARGRAPPSPCS